VKPFARAGVIDDILERSPTELAKRPTVPAESPTVGLSHLRLEAMLVASKQSANGL